MTLAITHIQNGISQDLFGVATDVGVGVYRPQISVFNLIPQASGSIFVCEIQNVVANVPISLNNNNVVTQSGYTFVSFPYLSNVVFSPANGATFGVNGTLTVNGIDNNFIPVQGTYNFTSGQTSIATTKTFKGITSITSSVSLAVQCEVTNGTLIGLPYFLYRNIYVLSAAYDEAVFAGTINVGEIWRTTTPSATTGDARGTINIPANIFVQDGLLTVTYIVGGVSSDLQFQLTNPKYNFSPNAITQQQQSLAQGIIYANSGSNPVVNVPALVSFDELGVQYPGNMTQYNKFPVP